MPTAARCPSRWATSSPPRRSSIATGPRSCAVGLGLGLPDDIRISENILTQLSDAYRRIRNTCRFILGNLAISTRARTGRPYGGHAGDRPLCPCTGCRCWSEIVRRAYERYEFHTIYHALYNFCTVDLSAFYLDILKGPALHLAGPDSRAPQRPDGDVPHAGCHGAPDGADPALYRRGDLAHMPAYPGKAESIHLASSPTRMPASRMRPWPSAGRAC
jgi:isoleucyl-tRNA synthetase